MIYIGFLLHAYQPPTQSDKVVRQIFKESYDPVIRSLEENKNFSISLDIAKSLAEQLPMSFRERIRELYEEKKIELVNTAAYHYLLPLVPEHIVLKQLRLNIEYFQKHFISDEKCPGIFPPELAFSPALPALFKKVGYSWFVADDGPFVYQHSNLPQHEQAPQNWIPSYNKCGALLRSNYWSEKIAHKKYNSGKEFFMELVIGQAQWQKELRTTRDSYIILAIDFETIGHHHKNAISEFLIPFFSETLEHSSLTKIVPLEFIFHKFSKTDPEDQMPAGSWSTSKDDLKNNIPFPLWKHPDNYFHRLWNEFMDIAFAVMPDSPSVALRSLYDKAFYSCTPWQHAHGNKEIAAWCMPMFKRLTKLLPKRPETQKLIKIYEEMNAMLR